MPGSLLAEADVLWAALWCPVSPVTSADPWSMSSFDLDDFRELLVEKLRSVEMRLQLRKTLSGCIGLNPTLYGLGASNKLRSRKS